MTSRVAPGLVAAMSVLTFGACGAPPAPRTTPTAPPRDGIAWAKARQLPTQLALNPEGQTWLQTIGAKRVVFLGEPDHYIHEKYEMRLDFLRHLVARGWRRVGMEMGRADGAHIDAYLESGDERELDSVGIYRAAGVKTARSGILKGLPPDANLLVVVGREVSATPPSHAQPACAPSRARPRVCDARPRDHATASRHLFAAP